MGGEEKRGPADEYEALRAQLLAGLRRQPGDTRMLMRIAGALSRMEAAEKGGSRRSRRDLGERVVAAMKGFEDQLLPPH